VHFSAKSSTQTLSAGQFNFYKGANQYSTTTLIGTEVVTNGVFFQTRATSTVLDNKVNAFFRPGEYIVADYRGTSTLENYAKGSRCNAKWVKI